MFQPLIPPVGDTTSKAFLYLCGALFQGAVVLVLISNFMPTQQKEKKHLGDFLKEYDDHIDDQKYYRGNAFARQRREREVEIDEDDRDRAKEKKENEILRLEVGHGLSFMAIYISVLKLNPSSVNNNQSNLI